MNFFWWSLIALAGFFLFLRLNPLWHYFRESARTVAVHWRPLVVLVIVCTAGWETFRLAMDLQMKGAAAAEFQWWAEFDTSAIGKRRAFQIAGEAMWDATRPFFAIFDPVPCSIIVLVLVFIYPSKTAIPIWNKSAARKSLWRGLGVAASLIILALLHLAGGLSGLLGRGALVSAENTPATGAARWLLLAFGFVAAAVLQMAAIRLFSTTTISDKGKVKSDALPKLLHWTCERIFLSLPFLFCVSLLMLPPLVLLLSSTGVALYQMVAAACLVVPFCAVQLGLLSGADGIWGALRLNFEFLKSAWMPATWFIAAALALIVPLSFLGAWLGSAVPASSLPALLLSAFFAFLIGAIHVWLLAVWTALYNDHLHIEVTRKAAKKKAARAR